MQIPKHIDFLFGFIVRTRSSAKHLDLMENRYYAELRINNLHKYNKQSFTMDFKYIKCTK